MPCRRWQQDPPKRRHISVRLLDVLYQNTMDVISLDICVCVPLFLQRFTVCDQNPAGWRLSLRCCNTDLRFSRSQQPKQTFQITSSTWGDRLAIPRMFINCRYIIPLIQTDCLGIPLATRVYLKREIMFSSKLFLMRLNRIFSSFFFYYLSTNTIYKTLVIIFDKTYLVSQRNIFKKPS